MADSIIRDTNTKSSTAREGKYLTFSLGNEEYGLEILKVREIIGYMNITAVPRTPNFVKGVINLRGQVIPVIDLRLRFGMEPADITDQTCIIVAEVNQNGRAFNAGLIVDRVQEVLDIDKEEIEEPSNLGSTVQTDFILGIGKVGNTINILLDIDQILSGVHLNEPSPETAAM